MAGGKLKTGTVKSKKEMFKSFIRRKVGVMKKARELSVLCGVQVALVIFGPDSSTPHVWPQSLENLHGIIARYFSTSQCHRSKPKRALNMSDFVKEDVEFEEHGEVISAEEVEEESLTVGDDQQEVDEIDRFSIEKLFELVGNLDAKLQEVESRIDMIKRAQQNNSVGNVQKVVPYPVGNYNHHQEFYFDEEEASMMFNGFNSGIGNNNNFHCGSQFVGAWRDSDVPVVLPLQAQTLIPNFMGMEEQVQSASFSRLAPWEEMLPR